MVRFEAKLVGERLGWTWMRLTAYIHSVPSSNQTAVLVFDANPSLAIGIEYPFGHEAPRRFASPFSACVHLVHQVVRLQEEAVWAVRDRVAAIENRPRPPGGRPEPDYRYFHDPARHAGHVTETLDTALGTMDSMLSQHEALKSEWPGPRAWSSDHQALLFFRSILGSLRGRSFANDRRLANEIQLLFHLVAQYDAVVSVHVGEAALQDSAVMKTIATLTMVFLPPTFVSAMFSMSFFNFDTEEGWRVSEKYWIYWAFAVPVTLATYLWWFRWQKTSNARVPKQ